MLPNGAYEIKQCTTMSAKLAWQVVSTAAIYFTFQAPRHITRERQIYISMSNFLFDKF
jgi:hypothetical protein